MGALDRFGVTECARELDVGSIEVERFGFGPQPSDYCARLGEALHRVGEVVVRKTVGFVLAPSPRNARS